MAKLWRASMERTGHEYRCLSLLDGGFPPASLLWHLLARAALNDFEPLHQADHSMTNYSIESQTENRGKATNASSWVPFGVMSLEPSKHMQPYVDQATLAQGAVPEVELHQSLRRVGQ